MHVKSKTIKLLEEQYDSSLGKDFLVRTQEGQTKDRGKRLINICFIKIKKLVLLKTHVMKIK